LLWVARVLLREPDQRSVVGMILRHYAVARVAIERWSGKRVRLGIDGCRMAARAAQRESFGVPRLAVAREQVVLSVAVLFETEAGRVRDQDICGIVGKIFLRRLVFRTRMDRQRVRVLLPGVGHFHAVAEEALVTSHVLGDRLPRMVLGRQPRRTRQDAE